MQRFSVQTSGRIVILVSSVCRLDHMLDRERPPSEAKKEAAQVEAGPPV